MARPSTTRMRQFVPFVLMLMSAAVAIGAYLQTLDSPFISDDEYYIVRNAKLARLHLAELWRLFAELYNEFFEFLPLRELSYWFDVTLFIYALQSNRNAFRNPCAGQP